MTASRPVLRYFGGKWVLAPWIISHFPEHRIYVEPFGGAASVLIRKPRSYAEIYNDLDSEIVGFFRVLRNKVLSAELERSLRLTPFARDEFDLSYEETNDPVESARRLVIRSFMGFGADGHNAKSGKTGFRANSNRSHTTPAHDWANYPEQIEAFWKRLSGVCIENRDALEVMEQQDSEDTLHFLDPPYLHETRGYTNGYKFEMTNEQHAKLCDAISTLKGMVILCGYENETYSKLGWRSLKRKAHADGARERTEVLWFNNSAWERKSQAEMFSGGGNVTDFFEMAEQAREQGERMSVIEIKTKVPVSSPPICRNCKHVRRDRFAIIFSFGLDKGYRFAKCGRSTKGTNPEALVTGKAVEQRFFCSTEREFFQFLDICGPEGKYFEPKNLAFWKRWTSGIWNRVRR